MQAACTLPRVRYACARTIAPSSWAYGRWHNERAPFGQERSPEAIARTVARGRAIRASTTVAASRMLCESTRAASPARVTIGRALGRAHPVTFPPPENHRLNKLIWHGGHTQGEQGSACTHGVVAHGRVEGNSLQGGGTGVGQAPRNTWHTSGWSGAVAAMRTSAIRCGPTLHASQWHQLQYAPPNVHEWHARRENGKTPQPASPCAA
jgi:hypothetical protein